MTSKKECPSCGLDVDNKAKRCHYCKYEFPHTSSGKQIAAYILIFLLVIWLLFGMLL